MKKLTHIAMALANNTLSKRAMSHVKGGSSNQGGQNSKSEPDSENLVSSSLTNVMNILEDEKRRERPGGGINTN